MIQDVAIETVTADALRRVARNQNVKAYIENNDVLFPVLRRAAKRYIGGVDRSECLRQVQNINALGHAATIDYMGESTSSEEETLKETQEVLLLVGDIDRLGLNSSVSLDLSHIGLGVSSDLAYANARTIGRALKKVKREMMISMEGSERTDSIFSAYRKLCVDFDNIGITLQARLHRTEKDLPEMLQLPGKIRLVKGAYEEPKDIALSRDDGRLEEAYIQYAKTLLLSGKKVSIGTHDTEMFSKLKEFVRQNAVENNPFEFEVLAGLGNEQINSLRDHGHPTRIYFVYGNQWYLYVCHRLAEKPQRLFQALIDIIGDDQNHVDDLRIATSSLFPHR